MQKKTRFNHLFSNISLTGKITLMYGIIFSAVFIVSTAFLIANTVYFYLDLSKEELEETVQHVSDYIQSGAELNDSVLKEMRNSKSIDIKIMDADNPFATIASTREFPAITVTAQKWTEPPEHRKRKFMVADPRYMLSQSLCEYNGRVYWVVASRQYQRERSIMPLFGLIFILSNILGIAGTFAIGRYVSRKLLNPIITVGQTAERISIEDLSQRIEVNGPDDEIRKLSVTFNDMIERLENSFKKQNRFISDASHELRTPIAVIQGYANLISRWGKSDPDVLQESVNSIKAETEYMASLVKKLLFLAKNDQNQRELQVDIISLNKLAVEVIKEMEVLEKPCDVELIEEVQVKILGDYDLIKQMFWIFCENSSKYCKGKPHIAIRIFDEAGPCVSVEDNGIGISGDDLPHVFERFYRADKSRSKEISGTGLGLSIADWIIKQHKAVVIIESVENKGTKITVKFERL